MKVNLIIILVIINATFYWEFNLAEPQNLQLSYAQADIAEKLIRSPTTTTPVPTTKKSTFFGGIRNLFSRKESTTVPPLPSPSSTQSSSIISNKSVQSPSTQPTTISTSSGSSSSSSSSASSSSATIPAVTPTALPPRPLPPISTITQSPPQITPTVPRQPLPSNNKLHDFESSAQLTLSTRPPKIKEDFPALPPVRNSVLPGHLPTPVPTIPSAWSTTKGGASIPLQWPGSTPQQLSPTAKPSASMVNFVPKDPTGPTQPTLGSFTTTTNIPTVTTDSELQQLTETLFNKESSQYGSAVTVNIQGKTQSSANVDEAPQPLLTVNEATLNELPTVAKLRVLYNNYELDTMVNEHVTAMERNEEKEFVDALLATSLMRQAMSFLQQKEKVTLDSKTHKDLLKQIWFSLYSRGKGKIGSSAFEHVFLNEIRNGTVSGFHNWIYYFQEEKAGHADYKGWLKKVDLNTNSSILKYRFSYNGINKPVNAMFVGTSPELEIALYTVCFALRADRECPVSLGGHKFIIRTHTFRYRGKNLIGSAFPEI